MELNLKNDVIFKAFFTKKGNEKYLKSFLESIIKEQIEIIRRSKFKAIKNSGQIRKIRYKSNNKQ